MCFWKPLGLNSFSWNWKLHLETYDKACVYACYILAMSNQHPPPPRAADKRCKFYSTKKKKKSSNSIGCIQLGTNTVKYTNYKHLSKHKPRKENGFLQLTSIPITFYRGKEFQLYLPTLLQLETLGWFYLIFKKIKIKEQTMGWN